MSHVEPELLAGVALGEPDLLSTADRRHLDGCGSCRTELDELEALDRAGRQADPTELVAPPAAVLSRVQAALAADGPTTAAPAPPTPRRRARPRRARPQRRTALLVAAALGVLVGGGTAALVDRARDDVEVLAQTTLEPLPGQTGTGTAELVRQAGVTSLQVRTDAPAAATDFRELWLLHADGRRMISLGPVGASGTSRHALPPQLAGDLGDYRVVDVSSEPYDGNVAHSGSSVVRGILS